ncbi:MAG: DUF2871 family protein [Tissierellia bacterium]|nr:DUF2871 family protein [Tissierellia bacterium]
MKKLFKVSLAYTIFGLVAGVFYREFTKLNHYEGFTSLKEVHPHIFVLGSLLFLILILFYKNGLIDLKAKNFRRFFYLYNTAFPLMVGSLVYKGVMQVLGKTFESMPFLILTGLFHIFVAIALLFLYRAIYEEIQ